MKPGILAAASLGVFAASFASEAWPADTMPAKAPPAVNDAAPQTCTGLWDFVATNCQLTWQRITVYGIVDVGGAGRATARRLIHDPLSHPHT